MNTIMISAIINGLTLGMAVFLIAAGVTLIYGILRVLNFAHGSFFMIGAYIAFSFLGTDAPSLMLFLAIALVAGLVVGVLGLITDLAILRRLRNMDEAMTLIATFALLLVTEGLVKLIWGLDYRTVYPPEFLSGSLVISNLFVPYYSLFVIVTGVVIFLLLDLLIHRMWFGKKIRAVAIDQWMSGVLGLNVLLILTITVVISFFLAGLAGGLLVPNQSLSPQLAHSFLLQAFIVVIIGGLGSIRGAFYASIILGLVDSLNFVLMPDQPGLAIYIAMIGFLLWRPQGLLKSGAQTVAAHVQGAHPSAPPIKLSRPVVIGLAAVIVILLVALPYITNSGVVFIAGLVLIDAIFALSWNLLFGTTGLAIFGHAAFFAAGAYFTGYLLKLGSLPFAAILLVSCLIGALMAAAVGSVALRRTTGIALAILTLAMGEIIRLLIGYTPALGSDDGLSAIPRPVLDLGLAAIDLRQGNNYYFFLCIFVPIIGALLYWTTRSRFGRVLFCIRQDAERTEFLGVNVRRYRLASFTIAGAVASLSGALYAPWVQIVSPDVASYLRSTQPMLNTLLGGSDFFFGPVVGTALFSALNYFTRTLPGVAELISGGVLLLIVLAAPYGILGAVSHFLARNRGHRGPVAAPERLNLQRETP